MGGVIGDRGSVAVIGSGIAGMQAALLLADLGIDVYLLEREAFIGGKFPLLDRTFPTNSCGICFSSPQQPFYCPVYECQLNERIEILPQTEIRKIEGAGGDFQVSLFSHPRFIDIKRCNLCGKCSAVCPVDVPDIWGGIMETRKAVYMPCYQTVPGSYVVDFHHCTRCGRCVVACPSQAVDLDRQAEDLILRAGAIIHAPGFEPFDARKKGEYGFGRFANVFSSLQFERMLSISGPTGGIPRRLSDGKRIEKLAMIQCVGSRDLSCGQEQCSTICCMITAKQALMAKERTANMTIKIFYMDVRPLGKDYERYYESVRTTAGITYQRSAVSSIHEMVRTKDLLINFVREDGTWHEETFDAAVLSVGYQAPTPSSPAPGIFTASSWHGPADVTETVIAGASAAAQAAAYLHPRRSSLPERKNAPAETLDWEAPRIGVLFCHCDGRMLPRRRIVDLVEKARNLPGVVQAEAIEEGCPVRDGNLLARFVKEHDINRLILAGCSPRVLEKPMAKILQEFDFNPYLISYANLSEAIAQVCQGKEEEATVHAFALVKMALERARRLKPLYPGQRETRQAVLVVGAGAAGMTAALRLAEMGHEVYLVEKKSEIGGNLRNLSFASHGTDPHSLLEELERRINALPLIHLWSESEVLTVVKDRGGYKTTVRRKNDIASIEHGALVIATGGREITPSGFHYGDDARILTQRQLGVLLAEGKEGFETINSIVMIQCVNSREETHSYCSRICCPQAVQHALLIKEFKPDAEIYVLYRDMRTSGWDERDYRRAREQGVIFINYDLFNLPEVTAQADSVRLSVYDPVLGERVTLPADLLVLSMGMEPYDNQELAEALGVELDEEGFFKAANPKAAPLNTLDGGKFICGLCLAPNNLEDVVSQANAVAARTAAFLASTKVEAYQSYVIKKFCSHCGLCISICPYGARSFNQEGEVEIAEEACLGCGACVAACSSGACRQYNLEKKMHMGVLDSALD
jgi:heterodisulfide reductase subunit A